MAAIAVEAPSVAGRPADWPGSLRASSRRRRHAPGTHQCVVAVAAGLSDQLVVVAAAAVAAQPTSLPLGVSICAKLLQALAGRKLSTQAWRLPIGGVCRRREGGRRRCRRVPAWSGSSSSGANPSSSAASACFLRACAPVCLHASAGVVVSVNCVSGLATSSANSGPSYDWPELSWQPAGGWLRVAAIKAGPPSELSAGRECLDWVAADGVATANGAGPAV
jgi:hypothetical protein